MSEAKTETAPSPPVAAPSGGGGSKLPLILTLVNLLATLGIGAVVFLSFQKEKAKPKVEDIQSAEGHEGAHGDAHGEAAGGHGEEKADAHGGEGGHGGATKHKNPNHGKMINLEQFQVNLSTPGGATPKYIRAGISLEVPNDDTEAEVNSKMPQVRNAIIDLFNSKRPGDILTVEGRDYLKEEIRNALNGFLLNGKVKGVYITGYSVSN